MRLASGDPAALALLEDMPLDRRNAADPAAWLSAALMKPVGLSMAGRAVDGLDWAERAYRSHLEVADRALYPHPASHLISVSMTLRDTGRMGEARAAGERAFAELSIAAAPLPRTWTALCLGQRHAVECGINRLKRNRELERLRRKQLRVGAGHPTGRRSHSGATAGRPS